MRRLTTPSLIVSTPRPHKLSEDDDYDTSIDDGSGEIQVMAAGAVKITARSTMFQSVVIEVSGNRATWSDNALLSEAKDMLETDYIVSC